MVKTLANFKSDHFIPFLPESSQVNDYVYGAELAWWLCHKLAKQKVNCGYPDYEDFTWVLSYFEQDEEFEIYCHNVNQKNNQWRIQIRAFNAGLFKPKQVPLIKARLLIETTIEILSNSKDIVDLNIESVL